MTRVTWKDTSARRIDVGLDRGVLYPKAKPAVPWVGLTGVDEDGADSSKTYYMDGRPYLIVPQPKEFSATIKAYTYPDEFSELMGLHEIADGMYADSQQGDSFDLSYRTMVANQTRGVDYGYKIHLIYNAVVAPQQISYGSMGDSFSPVDFSWNIQAVPVPVSGYRPTSHIIIDTQHLDTGKISEIENLLYGTDVVTVNSLPDPNQIFDMLNFGNTVVITDNGDGTWTATGSYDSIKVFNDGSFEIDDVIATINQDGTYVFGDTIEDMPTVLDGGTPTSDSELELDGGSAAASGADMTDGGTP